jgi:isopentenyl diphosphate isomerase/L-lactate dehydrogenase-like FMN-dependent dehydrogenase
MADFYRVTVAEYERRARALLPEAFWDKMFGSPGDPNWTTNANNEQGYTSVSLRPRILRAVDLEPDLSTEVLGQTISLPVILTSTGHHTWYHPDGESATARAGTAAGTIFALAMGSIHGMEQVAETATGPKWLQLFFLKDRDIMEDLVRRAGSAGYKAIMLTVTKPATKLPELSPVRGPNYPEGMIPAVEKLGNFAAYGERGELKAGVLGAMAPNVGWAEVEWLRSLTSLPLIVKGIQTAEDAHLAVEHGVDAISVSNHGGYSLVGARATIATLPEVVEAVDGRIEVLVDGGIRHGADVLKAVALGAKAVLVGRAMLWGLTVGGEAGVREILEIFREELSLAASYCGVNEIRNVDRSLVYTGHPSAAAPLSDLAVRS